MSEITFINNLPSIKDNLRKCQFDALIKVEAWINQGAANPFLVCMPTGSGKTGVIAISSFFIKQDVIIITPWNNLRSQMIEHIYENDKFWKDSKIDKPNNFRMIKFSGKDLRGELNNASSHIKTLWVTTFQGLWTIWKDQELYELFKKRIGLTIVDEGHYEPAIWWGRAVKELKCKTLLLTATPYRNDLKYFRIQNKVKDMYHYQFKEGIDAGILRNIHLTEIGDTRSQIVDEIIKLWSANEKLKYAVKNPKMIVCCKDYDSVKYYTNKLRDNKLDAIGIHIRANKKAIKTFKYKNYFRRTVPTIKDNIDSDIWVHDRMLTEGLDDSSFCVAVITYDFNNDRKLIQQIGRVVRIKEGDAGNPAFIFYSKHSNVNQSWELFLNYEKDPVIVNPEFYRRILNKYLKAQPEYDYFGKHFRKRFYTNVLDSYRAKMEVLTLPSVIVRRIKDSFDSDKFIDEVTDSIQLDDCITIGPKNDYPIISPSNSGNKSVYMWLYHRFECSSTLFHYAAYNSKLAALCVYIVKPYLFLSSTEGFIPDEPLDRFTNNLSVEELKNAFGVGYIPTNTQLTNSLPNQSVVRGLSKTGPDLIQVANQLSESKYICRSVQGRRTNVGRRYVGFNTNRISDDSYSFKRDQMNFDEFTKWCDDLSLSISHSQGINCFFSRFSSIAKPPQIAVPKYGFIDFWSGDYQLVDEDDNLYEPVDSVFEFCKHSINKNIYNLVISGTNNGIVKETQMEVFYKDYHFHFKVISEALFIKLNSDSSINRNIKRNIIDLATFCKKRHGDFFISLAFSQLVYNNGTFYKVDPFNNYKDLGKEFSIINALNQSNLVEVKEIKIKDKYKWAPNSVFGIISTPEILTNLFGKYDILICDHGKGEIADFIAVDISRKKIALIHCKSKPRTNSNKEFSTISELQEVVSQASKNIIYLSGVSDYPSHINSWKDDRKVPKYHVKIFQRKPSTFPEGKLLWDMIQTNILQNRDAIKEIWIVTGGAISKKWISKELTKLEKGKSNIICMFHMIDGLWSSCIEANIKLRFFCNQ